MKWLLRAVSILGVILFIVLMDHNEAELMHSRPRVARPELGYTMAISMKADYGFGRAETVFISGADNIRRLEILFLGLGWVVASWFVASWIEER